MSARFQEPEELSWRWPVLVRCPRCSERASISGDNIRLVCESCGLVREWSGARLFTIGEGGDVVQLLRSRHTGDWLDPETGRIWGYGGNPSDKPEVEQARRRKLEWPPGRDGYFGAELWLQAECCGGNLLWARNRGHLEYLRAYVAGKLREHDGNPYVKPLSSKLPTWMKQAKHREEVIHHLDRLAATLD